MYTYEEALNVIRLMRDNREYSLEEALENLLGLRDELDIMIEGIRQDIRFRDESSPEKGE